MSFWQGTIYLFQTELKRSRWNIIMLLFLLFFSTIMTIAHYAHIMGFTSAEEQSTFLGEYVFIVSFMGIGVMTTFLYGAGFKIDLLAERLAYYRSLPIRTNQIVAARMIAIILTTLLCMIAYYIAVATAIYFTYDQMVPIQTYSIQGFLLFSLMIIGNYFLLYFDLCVNSKLYTLASFIISMGLLCIVIILSVITENQFSLIEWCYTFSDNYPLLSIIIGILIFVLSSFAALKLLEGSLKKRSFF